MSALVAGRGLVLTGNIDDYPEGIILPVDKPYRWTSADVIRKLKYQAIRHFHKKNLKVGHAGTLDPLATGVLLVCIGKATKLAEELQASPKQYLAGVTFGATTPSYDLEKEIDRLLPLDGVSEAALRSVLPDFVGEQDQVAPLFSAKSVDGIRAYEMARRAYKEAQRSGLPFDHAATDLLSRQSITIYSLELEDYVPAGSQAPLNRLAPLDPPHCKQWVPPAYDAEGGTDSEGPAARPDSNTVSPSSCSQRVALFSDPIPPPGNEAGQDRIPSRDEAGKSGRIHVADISAYDLPMAMLRVDCSKGTYIRALARDLGEALGSGAFLSSLRRTRNGGIPVRDSLTLDEALSLFR
jgi:tRNA pseudouridine55 synthase